MTPSERSLALCVCGELECDILFGECHCGCRGITELSPQSDTKRGYVRGLPRLFIKGHQCIQRRPDVSGEEPFEYDGDICRRIPLTLGQWAIVLAIHFDWLMQWLWWAHWDETIHGYYVERRGHLNGKVIKVAMHREILGLSFGEGKKGDHKNGNTLDNRPRNLRPANDEESARNQKVRSTNKSGYKGVYFHKLTGKWAAAIRCERKNKHLGLFDTPELAYKAYCRDAKEIYGEFVRVA